MLQANETEVEIKSLDSDSARILYMSAEIKCIIKTRSWSYLMIGIRNSESEVKELISIHPVANARIK